ncbi:bi-domain-containing oxidoreductase [Propionispora hippei]|uniref:Predicted dehydrogenase n=1 Tax=Propionispora hippei DSM 15287 TaxID=1123003 RepID=A0A1M6K3B6_9FIRM|nr:bi-domain-containing oxidoreductase [Propionispora hippei]SHJ53342.1 Predicted dehydrogenase [Propionispora hippei DSM 15287]
MKQVIIKQGMATVEEVPAPQVSAGTVLVRVEYSCISAGTEMSGVKGSAVPLWKRAIQQPQKVKKVFDMVMSQGIEKTRRVVAGKLSSGSPTGYSAAGIVVECGEDIHDLKPGDYVACAGAQCAFHAEYISVPHNLVAKIPKGLNSKEASTVTVGAIAMQGVRRSNPTLGETFVIIGLGIIGQLTVQLLKANGCRVIGVEIDRSRINMAYQLGLDYGIHPDDDLDVEQVIRLTEGNGADGVIITAATPSDAVVSTAFKMCRRKGRVVLVGDVGLHLNRADFYQKELDFFISSSYGPGRYDENYEEKGLDYPIGYVRWTENRNMLEYLKLVSEEKVRVNLLIQKTYSIEKATEAYEALKNGQDRPMIVLLEYPKEKLETKRKVYNLSARGKAEGKIGVALAGAGGFAKGIHLPNIKLLSDYFHLKAVMSRTGHNAKAVASQFEAEYSTTDYQELLNDSNIDLIVIATRHNLHTNMALQALRAGKHVLVEKPLALSNEELDKIKKFYESLPTDQTAPVLLTGFNRRFSRYAQAMYQLTSQRTNPLMINYRMNAGYIPLNHWVHTEEGGGRNIGEACHIYDLFNFLTNSKVRNVQAQSIVPTTGYYSSQDNFVATVSYEDGSVATLTYTALGATDYPKEQMEVFFDGKVLILDDYKSLKAAGTKIGSLQTKLSEKGQYEEIEILAKTIQNGGEWPIPLWQQIQAMEIAFKVSEHLEGAVCAE